MQYALGMKPLLGPSLILSLLKISLLSEVGCIAVAKKEILHLLSLESGASFQCKLGLVPCIRYVTSCLTT